jgi:hypothetical protein
VRKLPTFKGYVVDARLRQFRKLKLGQLPEFIDFDSDRGRKLLEALREQGYTNPEIIFEGGESVRVDE